MGHYHLYSLLLTSTFHVGMLNMQVKREVAVDRVRDCDLIAFLRGSTFKLILRSSGNKNMIVLLGETNM